MQWHFGLDLWFSSTFIGFVNFYSSEGLSLARNCIIIYGFWVIQDCEEENGVVGIQNVFHFFIFALAILLEKKILRIL